MSKKYKFMAINSILFSRVFLFNQLMNSTFPALTAQNLMLEQSDNSLGELRDSSGAAGDIVELRERMAEDGYLFMRGYLDRNLVYAARQLMVQRLAADGFLLPGTDIMDAIIQPGAKLRMKADLAKQNEPLHQLLYAGRLIEFYRKLFGSSVRHFDYTWMRAVGPGVGTKPHCDNVYMGRGSRRLLTAWTPMGDIPFDVGGLVILEKSHLTDRLKKYQARDVDEYCLNRPASGKDTVKAKRWDGSLSKNPVTLQEKLGGRWLTTEFQAGDFITFGMTIVHGSLDNRSDRIRLSCDSRFQPAEDPIDERWIGPNPIGHSESGRRGRIC
jgi:hypothetical protein